MFLIKLIVRRLLAEAKFVRYRKSIDCEGSAPAVYGRLQVTKCKGSVIKVGGGLVLNAKNSKNTLEARGPNVMRTVFPESRLFIGDESGITSSTISCVNQILIGSRVMIGSGCLITDSDHHVVKVSKGIARRHLGIPRPNDANRIEICDDAFIGARSIILKGVRIGRNSVVGAGSVVTKDVEDNSIVAGNPAVVVGSSLI